MNAHDENLPSPLKPVARALEDGKPESAVRGLVGAALHNQISTGNPLAPWLTTHLGAAAVRQLIAAFAVYPCFVCGGGYELCETCSGKGRLRNALCEACLGFGIVHCKFCGGSGWATINFVPPGLRFLTVLQRVRLAQRDMDHAVRAHRDFLRRTHAPGTDIVRKHFAAPLTRWNRILAILENAVQALRWFEAGEPMSPAQRDQGILRCAALGRRADRHLRQILRQLSLSPALRPTEANFYYELVDQPTLSSELEHPFLRRAMTAAARRRIPRPGS
jgi:hypothetical protein